MQYWTWKDGIHTIGNNSPHYEILAPLAFEDFLKKNNPIMYIDQDLCDTIFGNWLTTWLPKYMRAEQMRISGTFIEVVGTMLKFPNTEIIPFVFPIRGECFMENILSDDFKVKHLLQAYNISINDQPVYKLGNANPQEIVERVIHWGLDINHIGLDTFKLPSPELYFLFKNGVPLTNTCDILMKMADNIFESEHNEERVGKFLKQVPQHFVRLLQLGARPSDYAFDALSGYNIDTSTKQFLDHQLEILNKRIEKT